MLQVRLDKFIDVFKRMFVIWRYYILQFLLSARRAESSVKCDEYGGHTPSDGVEDGHDLGLSDERDDEQCVQVQTLAKHPEVRGHQEVLYQDM